MSLIPLGFWAASGGLSPQTFWISTLGETGNETGVASANDSSDNFYSFGYTSSTGAGGVDFLLAKYNSDGAVQWQRVLGGTGTEVAYGVTSDSADNIYIVGYTASSGAGGNDLYIAKYNSSGVIQWQRTLGAASSEYGYGVAIDSSDNIYVAGSEYNAGIGEFNVLLAKYNSAGTIQWQRTLNSGGSDRANGLAIDSSDNIYVVGYTQAGAGADNVLLAKYDSAGTLQLQRILGGASAEEGNSVAIDSSNNVYVFGFTYNAGAGSTDFLLAKYNSGGTLQWQNVLGGVSGEIGRSVAIDSLDNVYVVGETASTGAGDDDFLFAKYDSAGTIQWQRTLGSSGRDEGFSVTINSADSIYLTGTSYTLGAGLADRLTAKIPNDGSLTGTYSLNGVNVVYAASSLTAASSSLTAATSSLTSSTSSLTAATAALTDASASLTSYLVTI